MFKQCPSCHKMAISTCPYCPYCGNLVQVILPQTEDSDNIESKNTIAIYEDFAMRNNNSLDSIQKLLNDVQNTNRASLGNYTQSLPQYYNQGYIQKTGNGKAIAALVCGILSIFFAGFVLGLIAIQLSLSLQRLISLPLKLWQALF